MNRLPWWKHFPRDWRNDPALSACSLAAQGLWMRMLCLAWECDEVGYLAIDGKPMSDVQIAREVGLRIDGFRTLFVQLKLHNVCSVDERGIIFSRRMVRDAALRDVRAHVGKLGGNPNLVKQKPETDADLLNQNGDVCLTKNLVLVNPRSQKSESESENPTPLVLPEDARARASQKTGDFEKGNGYKPVPLVSDTDGLARHAREMGINPQRFDSWEACRSACIAEGQRRRAAERGIR